MIYSVYLYLSILFLASCSVSKIPQVLKNLSTNFTYSSLLNCFGLFKRLCVSSRAVILNTSLEAISPFLKYGTKSFTNASAVSLLLFFASGLLTFLSSLSTWTRILIFCFSFLPGDSDFLDLCFLP